MNTVNLPLALFTVVLRRFIDKLRVSQTAVVLKNSPWFLDGSLFKLCFYAYMFSTGLYYTLRHMRKGTIVSLARKCSNGALNIKDRCLRNKWLDRDKKPWMVRNLTKNRESQQKALGYVASLLPQDRTNPCNYPLITEDNSECNPFPNFHCSENQPCFSNPQENPYFEPKVYFDQSAFNRLTAPPQTTNVKAIRNEEMPCITISDASSSSIVPFPTRKGKKKKRVLPRISNYLTLRNRKINKKELNAGEKIVRKTRSGKVYGCHYTKSRCKNRK